MLDSDDSAASEVASEPGDRSFAEESVVASEVDESTDGRRLSRQATATSAVSDQRKPVPVVEASSDAYENDYEDDGDDGYSDDFDDGEEDRGAVSRTPKPATKPSLPLVAAASFNTDDDDGYGESFEEESRRSMSLGHSARLVNLSVPAARVSPTFRLDPNRFSVGPEARSPSPVHRGSFTGSANSPNVDLRVLSKPAAVLRPAMDPTSPIQVPPAPALTTVPATKTLAIAAEVDEKKFSLLLRKVESKFEDELEELREKNAVLTWKERELKSELRRHREELRMRKARIDKKRKRAVERRHEHDRMVDKLRDELREAREHVAAAEAKAAKEHQEYEAMTATLLALQGEKRAVDERNFSLSDKLQTALRDLQELTRKFEQTVSDKLETEQRVEELVARHSVEIQVLEHKCRVDLDAAQKALDSEVQARAVERLTLPECHRLVVAAEKERFEKLEAALSKQMRELESQAARDLVRFEAELAKAWETSKQADERAERRVQDELTKIARERDAIDDQRRELLVSVTRTNARFDEERGKLDAVRSQLDTRQMRLVEERTELEARTAFVEERTRRIEIEAAAIAARKAELTKIGRETYEKTQVLTSKMSDYTRLQQEVDRLRVSEREMSQRVQAADKLARDLEQRKQALDQAALQVQQEKLVVAKQRMQSRYFLDGARKLEFMLQQQNTIGALPSPQSVPRFLRRKGVNSFKASDNQHDQQ